MSVTVGDIARRVDEYFPQDWAEPWDKVGLSAGDPSATVSGVLVTLDPSVVVVDEAASRGANVVVTHHPATLGTHERFTAGSDAAVLYHAASRNVALIAAHTNLDRAPGAGRALAARLGWTAVDPLESSAMAVDVVTVFVPAEAASHVRAAMASAGAGRIGQYEACSFTTAGAGRFTPGVSARPYAGVPGAPSQAEEERIEMIAPAGRGESVAAAAAAAHPYEEPLVIVTESRIRRGAARMGAVCEVDGSPTLEAIVRHASAALDCVPRVWGDPSRPITRAACATGSAGSLVPDALRAGADVLLAGEVRYHDALAALEAGLAVIEVGHDVSEWPLVPLLAEAVASTPGLEESDIHVDRPRRGWWTP